MTESLVEMFTSKKFIAALASVIGGLIARVGFNVDIETIGVLILPVITYIASQGWADRGKAAAIIQAANPPAPSTVVEQNVNMDDSDKTPIAPLQ